MRKLKNLLSYILLYIFCLILIYFIIGLLFALLEYSINVGFWPRSTRNAFATVLGVIYLFGSVFYFTLAENILDFIDDVWGEIDSFRADKKKIKKNKVNKIHEEFGEF